jgi:hypothetical protein
MEVRMLEHGLEMYEKTAEGLRSFLGDLPEEERKKTWRSVFFIVESMDKSNYRVHSVPGPDPDLRISVPEMQDVIYALARAHGAQSVVSVHRATARFMDEGRREEDVYVVQLDTKYGTSFSRMFRAESLEQLGGDRMVQGGVFSDEQPAQMMEEA